MGVADRASEGARRGAVRVVVRPVPVVHMGEVRIVLRDEEDTVALLERAAVVRDLALDHGREHHARGRGLDDVGLGLGRDGPTAGVIAAASPGWSG